MFKKKWLVPMALAVGLCFSSAAHAVLLNPGDTKTTHGEKYLTAGFTQVAQKTFSFNAGGFKGSLTAAVYEEAGGTLDFLFQLSNGTPSATIARIGLQNYTGFTTDVNNATNPPANPPPFVTASGQVTTSFASRSADGSTVTFMFTGSGITAGHMSKVFFIRTNAKGFDTKGSATIAGGPTISGVFSPTTLVPEPGSLAMLLGLSVPACGVYWWRRRKASDKPTAGAAV